MKLSELKINLEKLTTLKFVLPNQNLVPEHFHVTEMGQIVKHFIDCGGVIRTEKTVNFQLWYSTDDDHRLEVQKLKSIIALSETKLGIEDAEIEVEYQMETIGKFGLDFDGEAFILKAKSTDCLASNACGFPEATEKTKMTELKVQPPNACCTTKC